MGFRSRTGSNASRGSRGSHEFGDISMRRNYSSIMPVRENVALRLRSESLLQIEDRLDDILDQFCYTDRDCSKKSCHPMITKRLTPYIPVFNYKTKSFRRSLIHVMNMHENCNYKTLSFSSKSNRVFDFSILKHPNGSYSQL